MGLVKLGLMVGGFWLGLHLIKFIWNRRRRGRRNRSRLRIGEEEENINQVKLSYFNLQYTTTSCNETITNWGSRYPTVWKWWFRLGTLYGWLASLVGVGLIGYALVVSVGQLVSERELTGLVRRGVVGSVGEGDKEEGARFEPVLLPMIPGWTLPLSQLPLYIVSFLIAGIVHELGHALAAAAYQVPIHRVGLIFTLLYPGAFVELDTTKLTKLTPFQHMQVICGGVWHNFILASFALLLLKTNLVTNTLTLTQLYTPPTCPGWLVSDVLPSPLSPHLPPGTLLVQVNDTPVGGSEDPELGRWPYPLLSSTTSNSPSEILTGFCVTQTVWQVSNITCCTHPHYDPTLPLTDTLSCFETSPPPSTSLDQSPVTTPHRTGCLPAPPTFQSTPCSPTSPCPNTDLCVHLAIPPDPKHQWSRLYVTAEGDRESGAGTVPNSGVVHLPSSQPRPTGCEYAHLVLHYGDPREIPTLVSVTHLAPSFSWLPWWLPTLLLDFLQYLQAFSFALGILNILPVPYLDGGYLLPLWLPYLLPHSPSSPIPRHDEEEGLALTPLDPSLNPSSSPLPPTSPAQHPLTPWFLRGTTLLLILTLLTALLTTFRDYPLSHAL